jgi:hypothetical protein
MNGYKLLLFFFLMVGLSGYIITPDEDMNYLLSQYGRVSQIVNSRGILFAVVEGSNNPEGCITVIKYKSDGFEEYCVNVSDSFDSYLLTDNGVVILGEDIGVYDFETQRIAYIYSRSHDIIGTYNATIIGKDSDDGVTLYGEGYYRKLLDSQDCEFKLTALAEGFVISCHYNGAIRFYVFKDDRPDYYEIRSESDNYEVTAYGDDFVIKIGDALFLNRKSTIHLEFDRLILLEDDLWLNYSIQIGSVKFNIINIKLDHIIVRDGLLEIDGYTGDLNYLGDGELAFHSIDKNGEHVINFFKLKEISTTEVSGNKNNTQCENYTYKGNCMESCPVGYQPNINNICMNTFRQLDVCKDITYFEQCLQECPELTEYDPAIKTCYPCQERNLVYNNKHCLDICPPGYFPNNVARCIKCDPSEFFHSGACYAKCPGSTIPNGKRCQEPLIYIGKIVI